MRRIADGLLETAVIAILLLAMSGGLLRGAGPIGAVALPLGLAALGLAILPTHLRLRDRRLLVAGLLVLTAACGAMSGDASWPGLVAAGLLAGTQRAHAPGDIGCGGAGGLAAALLVFRLLDGLVDPADCFAWIAGLALAAVPIALVAGCPRPAPGPVPPTRVVQNLDRGAPALLLASQSAMILLMAAAPAGVTDCGLTPDAMARGIFWHVAAMSAPGTLRAMAPWPRRWALPAAISALSLAGALLLPWPVLAVGTRWNLIGVSVGFAWGLARLHIQGTRRGDLIACVGGAGAVICLALVPPADFVASLPWLGAVLVLLGAIGHIVQRAFARGGDAARDRRAGVILRILLDALRHPGIGQQFDQLQRLVEAGRDPAAREPVAVEDEARMAFDHDDAAEPLQA